MAAFNASYPWTNLSHTETQMMVLNHIVDRRVLYSPLLRDQGSIITSAGLDMAILFASDIYTVRVGNATARNTQFDVMHTGGVIHMVDAVLATFDSDLVRANQAVASAGLADNSFISGPVSVDNCASTQGRAVPPSPPSTDGSEPKAQNSTLITHDATHSGAWLASVPGALGTDSHISSYTQDEPQDTNSAHVAALDVTFLVSAVAVAAANLVSAELTPM